MTWTWIVSAIESPRPRNETAQFLKSSRQLVVVANRLPVRRDQSGRGAEWRVSPGGLVSALLPILKKQQGTWIGWTGAEGKAPEPFMHEGIRNVPVPLSAAEVAGYYEGFSNRTLWPLYHDAVRRPVFKRAWWESYVEVNRRFAEAVADEAEKDAIVWVHDYHLQLVPGFLRRARPDLRIGFFLHIPFPPMELFSQLPWRASLLEGLLGSDLFGCQTRVGAQNFARLCRRYSTAGGRLSALEFRGRLVRHGSFPISIDTRQFEELAAGEAAQRQARLLRKRLGEHRRIILGVDRLDYTKGIDIRLRAFGELLERGELVVEDCVFVQSAVLSRENVSEYEDIRSQVEGLVGNINGRYSRVGLVAIHYVSQNLALEELVGHYLAADVMAVTPLRDGMNLIAKEFVASRLDETGALVLSEFTGAAYELRQAVLVNPYDIEAVADGLLKGLRMPAGEARRRMRALRRVVQENDVYAWAARFLEALR